RLTVRPAIIAADATVEVTMMPAAVHQIQRMIFLLRLRAHPETDSDARTIGINIGGHGREDQLDETVRFDCCTAKRMALALRIDRGALGAEQLNWIIRRVEHADD